MKLGIFTIVLDGMPFIQHHLETFKQLPFAWRWSIAEGVSGNEGDTRWCKTQEPRFSQDGTQRYIDSIVGRGDDVVVVSRDYWRGKTAMCNTAIQCLYDCDVLLEVDVDEFHSAENICKIVECFEKDEDLGVIRMPCRFFVGPDLVCVGENCWSNKASEWVRAWRFDHSCIFATHEPPSLWYRDRNRHIMTRDQSKRHGLIFDHFAYATMKQVAYKEEFYGYEGLVEQWKALQNFREFPAQLNQFFPFVDSKVMVKRLDPSEIPLILKACYS